MGGQAPLCGSTFPPGTPVGRGGLFPWPGEKPLRFLCAGKAQDEEERTVLADNKCKCARVTSRIIRSTEDPNEDIVERNIRIIVPLNSRENISDPTSPLRTKFVYHLSDLCKKCDPTEVELDNQVVTATQSNICDEDSATETCYTYDRNKCYTTMVPLTYNGAPKSHRKNGHDNGCYAEFLDLWLDPTFHHPTLFPTEE